MIMIRFLCAAVLKVIKNEFLLTVETELVAELFFFVGNDIDFSYHHVH